MKLEAKIVEARGFWQRLRGLIGKPPPPENTGLLFKRCNAIHTCFMTYPIDAVFLDANGDIVKTVRNIKPWTLFVYGGRKAKSVVEMAASKAKTALALLALGACAIFSAAVADVMHVDFNPALTNGTDWTYSETGVSYSNNKKCLTLKGSGEITSPEFVGIAITNITLYVDFATEKSKPDIKLSPITSGENIIMGYSMVANANREILSNHCWNASEKVTGFRIWSNKNNSGVHLYAADIAYVSYAPYNLSVVERYRNALRIAWRSHFEVQSTKLTLYRNDITPESYSKLAEWDFSGVDAPSRTPRLTEDGFLDRFPGLSGLNIYYPNKDLNNGSIQIGTTGKTGYLCVDEIPDSAEELLLTAYVNNLDKYEVLPIAIVAGGVTNQTAALKMTKEKTRYRIPLEDRTCASSLYLINSLQGKSGPVLISDIVFASDFVEARTNAVRIARKMYKQSDSRALLRIPSPGFYTIEAVSLLENGKETPVTRIDTTVEETVPPLPERTVVIIY